MPSSAHLDAMVLPVLDEKSPCYIIYRLDDHNSHQNYLWVFMSYIPDYASVSGTPVEMVVGGGWDGARAHNKMEGEERTSRISCVYCYPPLWLR